MTDFDATERAVMCRTAEALVGLRIALDTLRANWPIHADHFSQDQAQNVRAALRHVADAYVLLDAVDRDLRQDNFQR